MGTFHDHRGELHGITVVVDPGGPQVYVGRCDRIEGGRIVLHDADAFEEGDGTPRKEEYLRRAYQVGVFPRLGRLVLPLEEGTRVAPLGRMAAELG